MDYKKVILIILDGWGLSDGKEYNAIAQAKTPNFDQLWNNFPHSRLEASENQSDCRKGRWATAKWGILT